MNIDKNTFLPKAAKFFAKPQNAEAKEAHFTSDGQCFRNINAARGQASILRGNKKDDSVTTIGRAEAEAWAKEQPGAEPAVKAYKDMGIGELRELCDKLGIEYQKNEGKLDLIGRLDTWEKMSQEEKEALYTAKEAIQQRLNEYLAKTIDELRSIADEQGMPYEAEDDADALAMKLSVWEDMDEDQRQQIQSLAAKTKENEEKAVTLPDGSSRKLSDLNEEQVRAQLSILQIKYTKNEKLPSLLKKLEAGMAKK